jgi:hypothetical protein
MAARYDTAAGRMLGRAIAGRGRWVSTVVARPDPGPRTREWLRAHGINLFLVDAGGLSTYERAFARSLYYVHNGGGGGHRNGAWSLQLQWGELTPRGRVLRARVIRPAEARAWVARHPRQSWVRHENLQSGGVGSPKQRFPAG